MTIPQMVHSVFCLSDRFEGVVAVLDNGQFIALLVDLDYWFFHQGSLTHPVFSDDADNRDPFLLPFHAYLFCKS